MQVEMGQQALELCLANFPMATHIQTDGTLLLWCKVFEKIPDDVFITAVMCCLKSCKMFPTVADIKQAIKGLQYEKQIQSRQILWNGKRDTKISNQVFKMVAEDNLGKYMSTVDIIKLHAYAKTYFPDISAETVRKNYAEFVAGMEGMERCRQCRTSRNQCISHGWLIKHWLNNKTGYVSNEMARCNNND